jgi:hypothetical protein
MAKWTSDSFVSLSPFIMIEADEKVTTISCTIIADAQNASIHKRNNA